MTATHFKFLVSPSALTISDVIGSPISLAKSNHRTPPARQYKEPVDADNKKHETALYDVLDSKYQELIHDFIGSATGKQKMLLPQIAENAGSISRTMRRGLQAEGRGKVPDKLMIAPEINDMVRTEMRCFYQDALSLGDMVSATKFFKVLRGMDERPLDPSSPVEDIRLALRADNNPVQFAASLKEQYPVAYKQASSARRKEIAGYLQRALTFRN